MRKDMDIIGAQKEFERVFSRRILGPYAPIPSSKPEIIKHFENQMRTMTAAYTALTAFIEKDKLDFINEKGKKNYNVEL